MDREMYQEWFDLETYHWWFVGRRTLFVQLIGELLRQTQRNPPDPLLIADMGCGTGVNLDALAQFGKVIGVDISNTALAFCRERKAYTLCQAPMSCLPFHSNSVHLLTAFDVIEHGEDDRGMLREAFRVCAPGGWAVFAVPAYHFMWGDHDVAAHHYRRYSAKEIRRKVENSGFQVQRLTYLNTFLFPISVIFRHGKNVFSSVLRSMGIHTKVKSDFRSTAPPFFNALLVKIFCAEFNLLRRRDFRFGLSICCIARKPHIDQ